MNRMILLGLVSVSALALGSLATPALAQTAPDSGASSDQLGEIIVTARKVAENVQRVPVAITAYSGETLQKQGARTLPDVAVLTPGLQMAPALTSSLAVQIQMRGQSQQDTLATLDPSVGTYVDGVYWARAYGLAASLVDIANFQALKGPQGTLFGRNTTGGAILVNTNDPSFSDGLSGSLSGTYGRFNQQSLTAVLNVPLVDDMVAARLVYSGNRRDAYVREINSGTMVGNINDYTLRGKLLIKPMSNFTLLLSGEKFHTDTLTDPGRLGYAPSNGIPFSLGALAASEAGLERLGAAGCFANPVACLAAGNAVLARDVALRKDQFNTSLSSIPHAILNSQTYSATATLDTSFGAIKAIGGYRKIHSIVHDPDSDASSVRILENSGTDRFGLFFQQRMQQWSGELTATGKALDNKLDFALGGFLFHEFGNDDTPASTVTELSKLGTGGLRPLTTFYGEIDTKSIGFYGQTTYHFSDKLGLTTGVRWSQDKRSLNSSSGTWLVNETTGQVASRGCAYPTCPFLTKGKFSGWAYTASLDYQASEDLLLYVKTAKGFRSGGLNLRANAAIPASLIPFNPEVVYSYEGGIKSELLDHRLRVNLAAYYTHTTGAQRGTTTTVVAPDGSHVTTTVISNAGVVNTYGAELDVTAILGGGFQVNATAAYTRPKYASFIDFNNFDRSHEPFLLTPRWTATLSPQWSGDIGANKLSLRTDLVYQSSQHNFPVSFFQNAAGQWIESSSGAVMSLADVQGYNSTIIEQSHVLVNANATLTVLDGKLDLSVWGKNLTNLKDYVNTLPITGLQMSRVIMREPRTYGVTATVKF